jgi:PhnB protein
MSAVHYIPKGFHSVTPYLAVVGAGTLIEFLKQAFGAEELYRAPGADGRVQHAELRIGDSIVEVGDVGEPAKARCCGLHLYVSDADAVYHRALAAGATSISEPADTFYGDRSGGVTDPCGNSWFIATHVEDVSPEELDRRMAAMGKK